MLFKQMVCTRSGFLNVVSILCQMEAVAILAHCPRLGVIFKAHVQNFQTSQEAYT